MQLVYDGCYELCNLKSYDNAIVMLTFYAVEFLCYNIFVANQFAHL
jgi:hypothetical protein